MRTLPRYIQLEDDGAAAVDGIGPAASEICARGRAHQILEHGGELAGRARASELVHGLNRAFAGGLDVPVAFLAVLIGDVGGDDIDGVPSLAGVLAPIAGSDLLAKEVGQGRGEVISCLSHLPD